MRIKDAVLSEKIVNQTSLLNTQNEPLKLESAQADTGFISHTRA